MRHSIRILGHSAGNCVSATSAATPRLSPDPAANYPKGQGIAEIVRVQPRGLAALPVPEAEHGPTPSWRSRVFDAALTNCRSLILSLQARHDPHALDDHLLRDIGLLRDQIQPPLHHGRAANRSYGARSRGAQGSNSRTLRGRQ
jgi:uncharacterized protein YjiS (DUF1127 family)